MIQLQLATYICPLCNYAYDPTHPAQPPCPACGGMDTPVSTDTRAVVNLLDDTEIDNLTKTVYGYNETTLESEPTQVPLTTEEISAYKTQRDQDKSALASMTVSETTA